MDPKKYRRILNRLDEIFEYAQNAAALTHLQKGASIILTGDCCEVWRRMMDIANKFFKTSADTSKMSEFFTS
jgi:hypothetical protein